MKTEELLTVKEVAKLLGLIPSSVYDAIEDDRLPFVSLYGRNLVLHEDARAYQRRTQPNGKLVRHRPLGYRP